MKYKRIPRTTIGGYELSDTETTTLDAVLDYVRQNGFERRVVPIREIFPARNNRDSAKRRTVLRLVDAGVLKACGVDFVDGYALQRSSGRMVMRISSTEPQI